MIPLSIGEIAAAVDGTVEGDHAVTMTAPAVLDARQAEPGGLFVAFAGGHVDGHDYADQARGAGAVAVLGSQPTTLPTVVVQDTQTALRALATHVVGRLRDRMTVIGLTGSQGKTSTKDLLAAVLSNAAPTIATIGSLNNELGVPLTMLRADSTTRFLVLEMGARCVGDITALSALAVPDIAVVLNVGQAHLGTFGSREAIARAKSELVQGLAPGGTAVLNADDPRVAAMRALTDGPVLTFGHAEHADVRVLDLTLDQRARPSFTLRTADASAPVALPLVGAHQALNAAAAAAAGLAAGVSLDLAATALATASLSKWRMESRDLADGATLLNDSFNANPDSTRAALDALAVVEGKRRIAVLGEMLELGDNSEAEHRAVGEYASSRADVILVIGEGARPIAEGEGDAVSAGESDREECADECADAGDLHHHRLACGAVAHPRARRVLPVGQLEHRFGQGEAHVSVVLVHQVSATGARVWGHRASVPESTCARASSAHVSPHGRDRWWRVRLPDHAFPTAVVRYAVGTVVGGGVRDLTGRAAGPAGGSR